MFLQAIGCLLLVTAGHCNVFSAVGKDSAQQISRRSQGYAGLMRIDKFVDDKMKGHIAKLWASPRKTALACGNDCQDASVYDQCGQSRRCFGVPVGCVATTNCSQLLSYGASDKSGSIPVDLYGTVESQQGFWIGFAPSRTGKMAIAAPVLCVKYPDGTTEVLAGFNSILHAGHHYQTLADPRYGIANVSSSVTNGYASCSFDLNVKRKLFGVTFDLTYPYPLLVGAGNLDATLKPTYHPVVPTILPKVVMACGNSCPTALPRSGEFEGGARGRFTMGDLL